MIGHIIFLVGAVADWWTTSEGLKVGFREGNPFVKFVLDKLPFSSEVELIMLKLAVYITMLVLDAPTWLYLTLGGLQLLIALRNFKILRRERIL